MEKPISIIDSLRQQIWQAANKNTYLILMCKVSLNMGWEYTTKEQYLKLLNEVKRKKANGTQRISK